MTALVVGINGLELNEDDHRLLRHPLVHGVILFRRNYRDYWQLRRLVRQIRSLKGPDFLIGVDQEGGRVARFGLPFTRLPPLGFIGRVWKQKRDLGHALAHAHGWLMAAELLSTGIDLSFAPVLDVDNGSEVIGDRGFFPDPEAVAELAGTYCTAMHTAGMKTTGKHFPGHGTVRADSHHELPVDKRPVSDIRSVDLLPFAKLIARNVLDAVMMAHVIYSDVCDQPAGYSKYWTHETLRVTLGFSGAVISDDLGMQAAWCAGSVRQRYDACRAAGVDVALTCTPKLTAELLHELPWRAPSSNVRAACRRLRGHSTLRTDEPFWKQRSWADMRTTFVQLMAMGREAIEG